MVFSHLRPLLGLLRLSKLPSGPFEAAGPSEPEDVPKASLLYSPLLQEAHNGLYKVLSYCFSANLITDRQPIVVPKYSYVGWWHHIHLRSPTSDPLQSEVGPRNLHLSVASGLRRALIP